MIRLSTRLSLGLLFLILIVPQSAISGPKWPFEGRIDLSSGFGDYRPGHFHFGIDLRTGGTVGRKVFAPVDGYIWRVRTAYTGYGKALYLMGQDDRLYVFAHLDRFNDKINQLVRKNQIAKRRYYIDQHLTENQIPVKKGDLVAYSGKTGIGAPHLHFESREADNTPLNPLTNGFKLKDKTRPTFRRIGFELTDQTSLFYDGTRRQFHKVKRTGNGKYTLDTIIYLHRPFGILADCFDQMRPGGMKQTIYKLSLYIDDELHFRSQLDSVAFETNHFVELEYDHLSAVDGNKRVRRLHKLPYNGFEGSLASETNNGVFGALGTEKIGLHKGRIVAEDCFGNKSELTFSFLWGPQGAAYALDSTAVDRTDTLKITHFWLSAQVDHEQLGIDSATIMMNIADKWGVLQGVREFEFTGEKLYAAVEGFRSHVAVLGLFLHSRHAGIIPDTVFNGILEQGQGRLTIEHEVIPDGLLVAVKNDGTLGSQARVELYYKDSLLGIEYPEYRHMATHLCLIPPRPEYRRVDRIGAALSRDTTSAVVFSRPVQIAVVGLDDQEWMDIDHRLSLGFGRKQFYEPRFVEIIRLPIVQRWREDLNSDKYVIMPEAFVCRDNYTVRMTFQGINETDSLSGICWYNEKKEEWIWLDNAWTVERRAFTAESKGGGTFAAIYDFDPPRVRPITVHSGFRAKDPMQEFRFVVDDNLSDIKDDSSFELTLDDEWLIPEYDTESGVLRSWPNAPMSNGNHTLKIVVTDRAGNRTEQTIEFSVM
ncbi:peptidoglycan DD-metalloendopeptidase family protein [candidate division GN15 bacterium]|nr:peptidoglycan DD-metalloendopeptidase family protein [candidate division GN15 bacterium]